MQFLTNNSSSININIGYKDKQTPNTTKFLGIMIDETLTWKTHVEMRTPKLSSAHYTSELRNLLNHMIF